jgi:stage V sporulation protein B
LIENRLRQALRFTFLTGGLSVVILFVLAEPLMKVMYGSTSGAPFIKIMAPFFLFYYYQGPLQAVLQALNLARAAMINSLIGAVVKTGVIFLLASQPSFGIKGAALGIITGFVLVTLLHFATVLKFISFTFYIKEYVNAFIVMGVTSWCGTWLFTHFALSTSLAINVFIASIAMTLLYFLLLLLFKLINKDDLKRIP